MKRLALSFAFLVVCAAAFGQNHHNIYAGVSPFSSYKLYLNNDAGEKVPLNYAPYFSGSVEYQTKLKLGAINLSYFSLYASYGKGRFDNDTAERFPTAPQTDVTDLSINMLVGTIINEYGRFQIPLAIGPGLLMFKSGPYSDNKSYQVVAKAGVTMFITDRLGIYAGGRLEHEFGGHKNAMFAEGGIIYSLGN